MLGLCDPRNCDWILCNSLCETNLSVPYSMTMKIIKKFLQFYTSVFNVFQMFCISNELCGNCWNDSVLLVDGSKNGRVQFMRSLFCFLVLSVCFICFYIPTFCFLLLERGFFVSDWKMTLLLQVSRSVSKKLVLYCNCTIVTTGPAHNVGKFWYLSPLHWLFPEEKIAACINFLPLVLQCLHLSFCRIVIRSSDCPSQKFWF